MKNVVDFQSYNRIKNLSFSDFNKWAISVFGNAYESGYKDGKAEAEENCTVSVTEDELMEIILSVKGIGQKRADELMGKICKETEEDK